MSGANGKGKTTVSRTLYFEQAPQRVVSLVPSLTESLFDLGVGQALVGITDYCIYPAEGVAKLPRLGGTKNPRLADILALQPDLVMANWEENTRQTVEELEAQNVAVWVSFPRSVFESMEVLWKLVELFRSLTARLRVQTLELTLDWAISAAGEHSPVSYFCPIWYEEAAPHPGPLPRLSTAGGEGEEATPAGRNAAAGEGWWMTFNQDTYCHDLLRICGGENVFAQRQRQYPLSADLGRGAPEEAEGRDVRYPRVTLDEILAARPEIILLPSEPFGFSEAHRQKFGEIFKDTPAVQNDRIYLVDGSLITWHGTRLARALQELPKLFAG